MSNPSDPNRSVENRAIENQAVSNQSVMRSNKKKHKQTIKNVKNNLHANQTLRINRNQTLKTHDERLTQIEEKVEKLIEDMKVMQKYTKLESQLQELQNTAFIYKLYQQNYPFHRVDIIHISQCLTPTNDVITDFDGLLFIQQDARLLQRNRETQRDMKNRWNAMHQHRNQNASLNVLNRLLQSTPSHKNAKLTNHSDLFPPHYIVIESKHSLSKGKVDNKMKQMDHIHNMLREAASISNGKDNYNEMIQQWLSDTQLPIDQLDHPIELIFSSDDVSDTLMEYIIAIHNGMTEEIYDRIVHKLLFEDKYMIKTISIISYELKKQNKSPIFRRPETLSMQQIRDILIGYTTATKRKHDTYTMDYITPFSELEKTFRQMQHHVGVLRFGHVSFSSLFKEPTLSSEI